MPLWYLLFNLPEIDCLESLALNVPTYFASKSFRSFCKNTSHSAHSSLEPEGLPSLVVLIHLHIDYFNVQSPGDGFEPPLKEPESFVLPLDDPGLFSYIKILSFEDLKSR